MYRSDFDDISEWSELLDFCSNYSLSACDGIISEAEVADKVRSILEDSGWSSVACFLEDCTDTSEEYYRLDGYGNLQNLSSDEFWDYKGNARDEFERYNDWDDEYDEEDCVAGEFRIQYKCYESNDEEVTPAEQELCASWDELFNTA